MFKAVIIYVILHCEEIWRTAGSNEKMTAVNLGVWSATIHSRINYQWLIQDLYWTEIKNRVGNTTARSILSLPNTFIVTVSTTYRHVFHLYYSAPTLPFHVITLYNTTHQFVVSQITSDLFSNLAVWIISLTRFILPSNSESNQTLPDLGYEATTREGAASSPSRGNLCHNSSEMNGMKGWMRRNPTSRHV